MKNILQFEKYGKLLFLLKMYNEINYYDYLELAEIQQKNNILLFHHLKQQKLEFREDIESKINEFNLNNNNNNFSNGDKIRVPPEPLSVSQSFSLQKAISWSLQREKNNFLIYDSFLKEKENADLRELMLNHKLNIVKILARIENMMVQDSEN